MTEAAALKKCVVSSYCVHQMFILNLFFRSFYNVAHLLKGRSMEVTCNSNSFHNSYKVKAFIYQTHFLQKLFFKIT